MDEQSNCCRRSVVLWSLASISGMLGLACTVGKEMLSFVTGPKLNGDQETSHLLDKQNSVQAEFELTKLRLERIQQPKIWVANLSQLQPGDGKLCLDYFLQPALVIKTAESSAVAFSAVCTHLGCTVQNTLVDGRIFCACHSSYFDVTTGAPLKGPAKYPLAKEPIVIEGDQIFLVKPRDPIKLGPSQTLSEPV